MQRTSRIFAVLLMLAMSSPLYAQQLRHPGSDTKPSSQQSMLSLDEAAARVRDRTGGQILSAKEYRSDSDRYYRFKVKNQGRVRVHYMRPDGTSFKPRR
ncbi:MAG TPA: hypothetical protein DDW55_00600 [Gammaproteobacteria bacterium]|nr:hypothetical protein [Gammaproteobacteria bacterium]